jgi:hypothetical protein
LKNQFGQINPIIALLRQDIKKHYWWKLYLGGVRSYCRIKVGHIKKDNKIDLGDNTLFVH